jgi:hypothetical protein
MRVALLADFNRYGQAVLLGRQGADLFRLRTIQQAGVAIQGKWLVLRSIVT